MHWATDYIGRPWEPGAQGPDAFDCWGLVRYIQARHFGKFLPLIPADTGNLKSLAIIFRDHPERRRWRKVSVPREGDSVLMCQAKHPVHVGLWMSVDGGGVLHCVKDSGVVFQGMSELALHGWRIEGIYRLEQKS